MFVTIAIPHYIMSSIQVQSINSIMNRFDDIINNSFCETEVDMDYESAYEELKQIIGIFQKHRLIRLGKKRNETLIRMETIHKRMMSYLFELSNFRCFKQKRSCLILFFMAIVDDDFIHILDDAQEDDVFGTDTRFDKNVFINNCYFVYDNFVKNYTTNTNEEKILQKMLFHRNSSMQSYWTHPKILLSTLFV